MHINDILHKRSGLFAPIRPAVPITGVSIYATIFPSRFPMSLRSMKRLLALKRAWWIERSIRIGSRPLMEWPLCGRRARVAAQAILVFYTWKIGRRTKLAFLRHFNGTDVQLCVDAWWGWTTSEVSSSMPECRRPARRRLVSFDRTRRWQIGRRSGFDPRSQSDAKRRQTETLATTSQSIHRLN